MSFYLLQFYLYDVCALFSIQFKHLKLEYIEYHAFHALIDLSQDHEVCRTCQSFSVD